MTVFNRRNAAVGWAVWTVGKRVARRKAKEAVPAVDRTSKKPNKGAVALLLAGAAGAVVFWRRRGGDDPPPTE